MTTFWWILLAVGLVLAYLIVKLIKGAKKYNHIDWGSPFLNFIDGLSRYYCIRFHRLDFERFSLPTEGGAILISNHISGLDPLLLIAASNRPIRFMIATEEYNRFGLTWLFKRAGCIPVNRSGRADIAFRQARRALEQGEIIALFPHGKIHLDHEEPYRVKPGIRKLAELSKHSIFVCRIVGVRGQGSVFTSLLLRSQSKIIQFPTINHHYFSHNESLHHLGEVLLGHRNPFSTDVSSKDDVTESSTSR